MLSARFLSSGLRLGFLALLVAAASIVPGPLGLLRPAGGVVALVGGTVVDGTGAAPRPDCTVLIEDERILAVGTEVEIPEGAEVVDVSGHTLVPGLIDMHAHLFTNLGAAPGSSATRSRIQTIEAAASGRRWKSASSIA